MSGHTPAPMAPVKHATGVSVVYEPKGTVVAHVFPYTDDPMEDRTVADATLFSAAPEMLEALETFPGFNCGPEELADWTVRMDAAICKAKGEEVVS